MFPKIDVALNIPVGDDWTIVGASWYPPELIGEIRIRSPRNENGVQFEERRDVNVRTGQLAARATCGLSSATRTASNLRGAYERWRLVMEKL